MGDIPEKKWELKFVSNFHSGPWNLFTSLHQMNHPYSMLGVSHWGGGVLVCSRYKIY